MRKIKNIMPSWLKYGMWFLIKAPQREIGKYTLFSDLAAMVIGYLPTVTTKRITICLGVYNRSEMLLEKLISSVNRMKEKEKVELSIVDFGGEEEKGLESRIRKEFNGRINYCRMEEPFTRARAINKAVEISDTELVFICDADFSLPENFVEKSSRYTKYDNIWFPIVYYLYKNKPEVIGKGNGEWMKWGGKGLVAIRKTTFLRLGGLDTSFKQWGGEDEEFWLRCYKNKKRIIRTFCKGMLHHWHPSLNPKYQQLEMLADKGEL